MKGSEFVFLAYLAAACRGRGHTPDGSSVGSILGDRSNGARMSL